MDIFFNMIFRYALRTLDDGWLGIEIANQAGTDWHEFHI